MARNETSRRNFLKTSAFSGMMAGSAVTGASLLADAAGVPARRPNIVLFCSDQMRSDFVGAYRENAMTKTPNIDGIVARGTAFKYAVTNQPLCSPSRACMITGRYALETGEWKIATGMDTGLPTLATELRKYGYSTNFIGKWHLMKADSKTKAGFGYVPPDQRHGFLDLWEGANEFEHTTHPYYGTIWDQDGNEITYRDQYRADFITGRAVRFLRQPQTKPFLLFISHLEPHQQNDENRIVAPKGYADRFKNPTIPASERSLPGDWQDQLPDYYGCIEKIDESVGTVLKTLKEHDWNISKTAQVLGIERSHLHRKIKSFGIEA